MKKKTLIIISVILITALLILFIPIPGSPIKDGGTRAYSAVTYKVVKWQRLTGGTRYKSTSVYWFPNNRKTIDELWTLEMQKKNPKAK